MKENQAQKENIHLVVDQWAELQAEQEVVQLVEPIPFQEEILYPDHLPQADEVFLVMIAFQDPGHHPLEDPQGHLIHKNKMGMWFIVEDNHTKRSLQKEVITRQHRKSHFKSK
mgnify:CR=1 FL=1